MSRSATSARLVFALVLLSPALARADIVQLARCQRSIAGQGANYAKKVILYTLDCTVATANCQIQCEQGVFGPPCDPDPTPGCCDPDDRNSNAAFAACMADADIYCLKQTDKITKAEARKAQSITNACSLVTQDELCGSQTVGLNFDALNAGCLAKDPSYTCSLPNLLACVAGPLERELADQISNLLHPRASDAITALGLQSDFPGVPTTQRVTGTVPEGKADVYAVTGQAGDEVLVRVKTRDDGGGLSSVHPTLVILEADLSPIPDSTVRTVPCNVPNVCGSGCPELKRVLPFSGTYHVAVGAATGDSCAGGSYKLVVTSPGGAVPQLVMDDVDATSVFTP